MTSGVRDGAAQQSTGARIGLGVERRQHLALRLVASASQRGSAAAGRAHRGLERVSFAKDVEAGHAQHRRLAWREQVRELRRPSKLRAAEQQQEARCASHRPCGCCSGASQQRTTRDAPFASAGSPSAYKCAATMVARLEPCEKPGSAVSARELLPRAQSGRTDESVERPLLCTPALSASASRPRCQQRTVYSDDAVRYSLLDVAVDVAARDAFHRRHRVAHALHVPVVLQMATHQPSASRLLLHHAPALQGTPSRWQRPPGASLDSAPAGTELLTRRTGGHCSCPSR